MALQNHSSYPKHQTTPNPIPVLVTVRKRRVQDILPQNACKKFWPEVRQLDVFHLSHDRIRKLQRKNTFFTPIKLVVENLGQPHGLNATCSTGDK